jgi:tetrahydromethanopterin S-methyltransferase subunit F
MIKRKRILDCVSYIAVALLVVGRVVGRALSGLDEDRSKGIIAGCLSAVVVFGMLMQQF